METWSGEPELDGTFLGVTQFDAKTLSAFKKQLTKRVGKQTKTQDSRQKRSAAQWAYDAGVAWADVARSWEWLAQNDPARLDRVSAAYGDFAYRYNFGDLDELHNELSEVSESLGGPDRRSSYRSGSMSHALGRASDVSRHYAKAVAGMADLAEEYGAVVTNAEHLHPMAEAMLKADREKPKKPLMTRVKEFANANPGEWFYEAHGRHVELVFPPEESSDRPAKSLRDYAEKTAKRFRNQFGTELDVVTYDSGGGSMTVAMRPRKGADRRIPRRLRAPGFPSRCRVKPFVMCTGRGGETTAPTMSPSASSATSTPGRRIRLPSPSLRPSGTTSNTSFGRPRKTRWHTTKNGVTLPPRRQAATYQSAHDAILDKVGRTHNPRGTQYAPHPVGAVNRSVLKLPVVRTSNPIDFDKKWDARGGEKATAGALRAVEAADRLAESAICRRKSVQRTSSACGTTERTSCTSTGPIRTR